MPKPHKVWSRTSILHSFKYLFSAYYLQREKGYFTLEKPGGHHFDQEIKFPSPMMRQTDIMYLLTTHRGGRGITSAVFVPKVQNLTPIRRQEQTNPRGGTFYQTAALDSSQRQGHETEEEGWGNDLGDSRHVTTKWNVWSPPCEGYTGVFGIILVTYLQVRNYFKMKGLK